jgi:MFS family permease
MIALGLFGVASLAGGSAQNMVLLLASRAVQGVAGALLFAATLSLVISTFAESHERNHALFVWGSAGAGGWSLGRLAGGALAGMFGWRAVFFVSVPITAALLTLTALLLPQGARAPRPRRVGSRGAALVTLGVMVMVDALGQVPPLDWSSVGTLLGGPPTGLAGQSPGVLTGSLYTVFAAMGGVVVVGAAAALLVISGRKRAQHRQVGLDCPPNPAWAAAQGEPVKAT